MTPSVGFKSRGNSMMSGPRWVKINLPQKTSIPTQPAHHETYQIGYPEYMFSVAAVALRRSASDLILRLDCLPETFSSAIAQGAIAALFRPLFQRSGVPLGYDRVASDRPRATGLPAIAAPELLPRRSTGLALAGAEAIAACGHNQPAAVVAGRHQCAPC